MTKTVLITGANKGIGFEVARQMGQKGWTVLLGARNEDRGLAAVRQLKNEGLKVEWLRIDMDDLATVREAAVKVSEQHPELKILINNAGISGHMSAEPLDVTNQELKETLTVNVLGNFEMIKAFTPILRRNHGRIVNLTIPVNYTRFWHPFSYIISKSGLNQMIKMVGQSFRKQHIPVDVFGIIPGGVTTDLNGHMSNPLMHTIPEGASAVVKIATDSHHHQGKIVTDYGATKLIQRLIKSRREHS
ncbi:SDR family NAD(P)-dependent oxidoreductase [Secundilactobacillus folii]|uniref:SDR family NAD(P)-dependent oxidoreductase n=1 Tax=Secundilactobacillus folii TaxID=2678357 RepID=A0A7X2XWL4_9LACO|nr:SDR family NAD(P)-dependent oxidoreductase [Secundilactobacillus folii]MTV82273.1 SDR family NAD(P)-dependent oxidoreductase [Secundilactobacillus folii]